MMANVIAVIWDFDKTLVDGYMQDPIFSHYGVDGNQFWKEVHELPEKYWKEQGVRVNRDTIYLNHFLRYVREGIFPDLNNEKLKTFGKELQFYPGIPEIFEKTKRMIADDPHYKEYDIKVEHYIVSTGMLAVIKGTAIMDYVDGVWGNELIEDEINGRKVIAELGYTIDNTSKTRAIFEINKGVPKHPEIDVNSKVPAHKRRVPFENMIYIADGPSDIPAFSLVNKNGGSTFAIYPKGDARAFRQVEQLRMDGRIHTYAEADYREGTTAQLWICSKIMDIAERIRQNEKKSITESISKVPIHL